MLVLPILFKIGSVSVHTYGVAIAAAFLASIFLIRSEAKRKGFHPDLAYDIVLFAMVGGIVGARLFYVIGYWHEFTGSPMQIFAIWQGGLVFYGGFVGGALAVLGLIKFRKLPLGKVADMIAPSLALGSAIGRLGCFANGCCCGKETTLPWGVKFTSSQSSASPLGVPLHPTQLYEFTYNIIILGLLLWARPRIKSDGLIFWIYISMYGLSRFIVEFFRTNPTFALGLGRSQIFSLFLLVTGLIVIFGYYFRANSLEARQADE